MYSNCFFMFNLEYLIRILIYHNALRLEVDPSAALFRDIQNQRHTARQESKTMKQHEQENKTNKTEVQYGEPIVRGGALVIMTHKGSVFTS